MFQPLQGTFCYPKERRDLDHSCKRSLNLFLSKKTFFKVIKSYFLVESNLCLDKFKPFLQKTKIHF